jgi:hypothetical protein
MVTPREMAGGSATSRLTMGAYQASAMALEFRGGPQHHRGRTPAECRAREGQATGILWTFTSPELWDLLVIQRGWTPARYGHWLAACSPPPSSPHSRREDDT